MPTKYDTKQLDVRQWTQVKAALTLWLTVQRNSRTHPATHSNIEPLFANVAPLEEDEIELLIEGLELPPYMDVQQFADVCGVSKSLASNRIRGAGIKPVSRAKYLYRTADLMKARKTYE